MWDARAGFRKNQRDGVDDGGRISSAHAAHADVAGFERANTGRLFMKHGLAKILSAPPSPLMIHVPMLRARKSAIRRLPNAYRRIVDGEVISIGKHRWQINVTLGHAPGTRRWCVWMRQSWSQTTRFCPPSRPTFRVWGNQPESNPLLYLAGLDMLASPARKHAGAAFTDRVFRGLHAQSMR